MKLLLFITYFIFGLSIFTAQNNNITPEQENLLNSAGLQEKDVDNALKQTLEISTDESVKDLSNEKLIQSKSIFGLDIPKEVKEVSTEINKNGDGQLLGEIENAINMAGGQILDAAKLVFDNAINRTDFKNAMDILMGKNNAATEWLKNQSGDQIESALKPIVQQELMKSGALEKWNEIVKQYTLLTGQPVTIDLADYITQEVVDSMFDKMGQEEAKIRLNQYFWGSTLLKAVMALQHKVVR